ncbi:hypothetical protein ADJ79_12790 [Ottowia sp. oral taxon 894]|uniref:hypothetical protein n=1 Tax=Ottowia sp. oral taxon 894 TaxID=1658672 RepID=UPI0006817C17|nr:hypothetical protein [Ottowia sp. oral taxon 894]AKU67861.1 hypothetical protein ADJ79_12790 [Ottowia sp. oral taxon 894]
MGLPAFSALPTFIPSFEPKRDSEPPYRPQVQPQPPQPQPRPELQPAVQAQQTATQAATTQAATQAEAQAASTQAASVRQQEARAAAGQTPTPQTATQAALQAQRLTPAALAAITRTLAAHQQQAARMGALLMAAAGMAQPLAVQQAQRQLLAQALALALLAGKGQASAADMALLNATRQSAIAALTAGLQAKNANVAARMGAAAQQTAAQAATQTSATRQSAAQTATQASSVQSAQAKQAAQEGKAKAAAQAATQAGSATQAKGREAAQAQQVAGQQASQEKTGIHKRVSLRNVPKGRARGTLDKVEAVSRNMGGPQGQPEPEDEDLDWLEQQGQQGHEAAQEQSPAARKYQAIALWLLAHGQMAALRELAHGHRVLLLAPAADAPLTLVGHVLVPERAAVAVEDGASQMGAQGQALELPARWTQALPADRQWRQWKLRQQSDESGWSLQAPRPERGTPRLLAADNAADPAALANTPASATESAPERAELITLPEPRRLRRLLDGQWAALAGQAAACLALGGMLHDLLRLKKQRRKRRSGWAQLKKRNTCRALRACPGAAGEKKPAQARTNCNIVFLRGLGLLAGGQDCDLIHTVFAPCEGSCFHYFP